MDLDLQTAVEEDQVLPLPSGPPARRDRIAEIVLHSDTVLQILGVPPHWLVRWGATAMAIIVVFLFSLGWLIHYPDIVPASIVITTPTPPSTVVAQASGHLIDLGVRDGDEVQTGSVLARIQNTADPAAVEQLDDVLKQLEDDKGLPNAVVADLARLPLGELQADYAALARAHAAYVYNLLADPLGVQMHLMAGQGRPLRQRIESLQRQHDLLAHEVEITQQDLGRMTELVRRRDASLQTLSDRERTLLAAKRAMEGVEVELANSRLDLDRLDQSLTELNVRARQQKQDLRVALLEAVKTLRGRISVWDRSYVLKAPISGRVSLSRYWTNSQFVRTSEEVMAIVPAAKQSPVGKLALPVSRSGSVYSGQTVFIRLDNYPSEQFGLLKGFITTIAPVPRDGRYTVEVSLPSGLSTTFGRQLAYQQEMPGQADIMIEDLRVIERIFYQFRRLFVAAPVPPAAAASGKG